MLRLLYDVALLLVFVVSLPKFLWEALVHKKYRKSFLQKLGFKLPKVSSDCVWIHAVSVGETKAVIPLVKKIQKKNRVVFSATTETGLAEAKRNLPDLEVFYLPLDFSWNIRRLTPKLLILVESDFWYNLVTLNKTIVVNGKISEKSARRFQFFRFFARRLFGHISLFCVQNQLYADRFASLGIPPEKIFISGNLKFDYPIPQIDVQEWKQKLGITGKVITIGSTHETEEEEILSRLPLTRAKILLVPRHPERFSSVAALLQKKGIAFDRYTDSGPKQAHVLLVDTMGLLMTCYQLSDLAIVGGSFVSHVGGHNIFEPVSVGVPVLFGPHMESQKELVDLILQKRAGRQVTLNELSSVVSEMLDHPPVTMKLAAEVQGSTERTWQKLVKYI